MATSSIRTWCLGLALLAGSACAAEAERPDVHVGDRWNWQHTNVLAHEADFTLVEDVVEVGDREIRTRVRTKGKAGSSIATYTREWNPLDVVVASYQPDLRSYTFPLQVGAKWQESADKQLFSNGKHGKFNVAGEVQALEQVTVPAGTFEAYKVSLVLEATSTDEDANIGHTSELVWYAPAVRRYVKLENTFSRDGRVRSQDRFELTEFTLR